MKLTIKKAIEEGYKHCIIKSDEQVIKLSELEQEYTQEELIELLEYEEIYLCEKEPIKHNVNSVSIKSFISSYYTENHAEFMSESDIDKLYIKLIEIDCSEIVTKINEILNSFKYYESTNIILVQ